MTTSNWLNENFVSRPGYDHYYFNWPVVYTSQRHYEHFMRKNWKYIAIRCTCRCAIIFLTCLKRETRSGYPGNCKRVPGY